MQSVTCLATDACLTADPWVASLMPVWFHTFVEIDHEIISMVILLPSAVPFKKGCCQSQVIMCTNYRGEFNNASARRALVDWYLSLFIMCKA